MSSEHATETEPDRTASLALVGGETEIGASVGRRTVVVGVSLLALVVVGIRSLLRLVGNVPFDPVVVSPALRSAVGTATPLVVGTALATLALTDDRATVRVGLLFAAVFGSLGVFAPAATLPAVVALVAGATIAFAGTLGVPAELSYRAVRSRLLAAGFVAAIAVSLADSTGIVEGAHWLGSLLALATLAAVGTRAERSVPAAGAGVLVAALLVYASTASPFVVGSALLVVFAVTGVPHLLFAGAVAGGVAAATAGLSRRAYPLAIGATLLVLAGIPVTLPRALTLLLGATLVVLDREQLEVAT